MMTESRSQVPVIGRSSLLASRADRERVIGALKTAFVQGMLTKDEFDQRVGQTLAARTYGELAAATADIPAYLAPPRPVPAQAQRIARPRPPGLILTWATVAYSALWPVAFLLPAIGREHYPETGILLVMMATFFYLTCTLIHRSRQGR